MLSLKLTWSRVYVNNLLFMMRQEDNCLKWVKCPKMHWFTVNKYTGRLYGVAWIIVINRLLLLSMSVAKYILNAQPWEKICVRRRRSTMGKKRSWDIPSLILLKSGSVSCPQFQKENSLCDIRMFNSHCLTLSSMGEIMLLIFRACLPVKCTSREEYLLETKQLVE